MPVFIELNQQVYQRLHQQLLNRITDEEQILHNGMKDPVTNPAILEKKPWNRSMMYLRYAYEAGPRSGNHSFVIKATPVYDGRIRVDYELQVWKSYYKLATEHKHWAKEVVDRTKKRNEHVNLPFIEKKIDQACTKINDIQIHLATYWLQIPTASAAVAAAVASINTTTNSNKNVSNRTRIKNIEKLLTDYIKENIQRIKKMSAIRLEIRIMKKNYHTTTKRLQMNIFPKLIAKTNFQFKFHESILDRHEMQELDLILQNLHSSTSNTNTNTNLDSNHFKPKKTINYRRTIKRLQHKFRLTNTILRKTDKSKVFHLGTVEHYEKQSKDYMERTKAYDCIGQIDPLPELIKHTNKYLLDLRLKKWITPKQYEQLCLKQTDDIELAHLYYLPKAHKPLTPLRPIMSGRKHPTTKISKYLDDLLRPLFNQMASKSTITCGFELIKHLQKWTSINLRQGTSLCTIDVVDLYTMIPQMEGVLALEKMIDHLQLKQVDGLTKETIIRLAKFVMQNNYFKYKNDYYHQIRGGAMGSPLTLTIANCYMFFFEQSIIRQINNSYGLYFRYIDDIIILINWPNRHLKKEINRWNTFDENIQLSDNISNCINFLDLHIENQKGQLITKVYHKPSYQPYYLPFNSIHPLHMKANIPFTMLLRAIRYCSSFEDYFDERGKLRMDLLVNKYPVKFIDKHFTRLLDKFNIHELLNMYNYNTLRQQVVDTPHEAKAAINYQKTLFVHFTYCQNMTTFPRHFHTLWNKYFEQSPINEVTPILGTQREEDKQNEIKVMDIDDANDDSEVIDLRTPVNEIVATSVLTLTDNTGIPLRPIISSINGPTNNVSHFLDHLIRPLFDHVAKQTTFINDIDLVRQLEKYQENGHLLPTTHFITFDVTDLYTMIPRNGALEALGRFLAKASTGGKIGNLSIDTILKLARLVLDTNYFVYNNKYYRQIKGGAMGSAFTMTLANVYMLEWEQPLPRSNPPGRKRS
ncbi:unnamed protein product [Adineta steineri]|uniref:Reverse transcriptase domain-containing protein n=1 Tax=Adineta steineri TaxID=433720 RepID=A0A814WVG4_9BILA|nr:unnamed protein product [Adineta steineri]CAF1477077.1 unnamed protein product [Adineta steineri]